MDDRFPMGSSTLKWGRGRGRGREKETPHRHPLVRGRRRPILDFRFPQWSVSPSTRIKTSPPSAPEIQSTATAIRRVCSQGRCSPRDCTGILYIPQSCMWEGAEREPAGLGTVRRRHRGLSHEGQLSLPQPSSRSHKSCHWCTT